MKTEYYSSLPNKKKQPPTSPVFTSSSISLAVTSSAKKLLSLFTPLKRGALKEDEIPVIYYTDEDSRTVKRKVPAFIDPYSFVPTDENGGVGKKSGDFNSPTSVIPVRLFPEAADGSVEVVSTAPLKDSDKLNDDSIFDPVVTFECPVFSLDAKKSKKGDDDDTTSLQLSEAIRSINIKDDDAKSVREKLRDMKDARNRQSESTDVHWEDPTLTWKGFTRSSSWRKYEWEDDAK